MTPHLHVVTGKGGVGKSTVAAALAVVARAAGQRVLAVELEAEGGLGRALGARGTAPPGELRSSDSGVSVSYFDGAAALAEYLRRIVRLGPMLEPVLRHPLYRAFVGAAPGLSELMLVGKLRDELVLHTRRHGPRWDTLVLDVGSTGHALELLRMPQIAAQTFRSGRVHQQARQINAWLTDPERVSVHVVALPEEMPIREAAELVERLAELELQLGLLIVNGCRDIPPPDVNSVLAELDAKAVADSGQASLARGLGELARRELGWQRLQARAIAQLEQWTARKALRLPLLTQSASGQALAPLAAELGSSVR